MSRSLTLRKKGLAIILCMMMAVSALSGCGKEPAEAETEEEEDDGSLKVPDIKGKVEEVGAFTVLVPKGMNAETGLNDSEIYIRDDDDPDKVFLRLAVVDKSVKESMDPDYYEDAEKVKFVIDGEKWTGLYGENAYEMDSFKAYSKIDKQYVLVTCSGYSYDDDIPVAVMASIEVDPDAPTYGTLWDEGLTESSNGGEYNFLELYSVHYDSNLKTGYNEGSDLASIDGTEKYYFHTMVYWDAPYDRMSALEAAYPCYMEIIYSNGLEGYLYAYEYDDGYYTAEFFLPLDYKYANTSGEMTAVHMVCDYEDSVSDGAVPMNFYNLIYDLTLNYECWTDEAAPSGNNGNQDRADQTAKDYWERGWYGWWICADASEDYAENISFSYDSLATFDFIDDQTVHFRLVDVEGNLDFDLEMSWWYDGTPSGWLVAESGDIMGTDVTTTGFAIDPESTMYILEDYLAFDVYLYEGNDYVEIRGFLRPWGSDFEDFYDVDEDDLPYIFWMDGEDVQAGYADMFPFNYDSWYVGIKDDPFPGLYAIEGQG